jgi:hypothetical protein
MDRQGQPCGEIANWGQIQFPFDPELQGRSDLAALPVTPLGHPDGIVVREEYSCDAAGSLRVRISAEPAGYAREFSIDQIEPS